LSCSNAESANHLNNRPAKPFPLTGDPIMGLSGKPTDAACLTGHEFYSQKTSENAMTGTLVNAAAIMSQAACSGPVAETRD
jgi:hypothetical protein